MQLFQSFPLWVNLGIVAVTAVIVWRAGVRVEAAVEAIARRTGLGSTFGGLILLPIAASLPELATTISGGVLGNAELVTNNLLGGIAMQTAILVAADAVLARGALTRFSPHFSLLIGGVSLVLLLGLTLAVMAARDPFSIAAVGLGSTAIFAVYLVLLYLTHHAGGDPRWRPTDKAEPEPVTARPDDEEETSDETPLRHHWVVFAICCAVILVAGWAVMNAAEALTHQTGIGASFIGATFVAITTSLPELSTVTSAVRRGDNEMAISNVFGSNLYDVSMLFIGDLVFRSGPLLAAAPRQAMFTASLGIVLTCVYLWGLLERRDRTIWRFGIDSALVLVLYAGGLVLLYRMG